ncbi:MAG: dethiobiotin synthase [Gammaproteobacteria bacterium]
MTSPGRGLFITGTDTGVGKTQVTLGLMSCLHQRGLKVAGMKPVASGCYHTEHGLRNADAVAIQKLCSISVPYRDINPYALEPAIAPHIAAEEVGTSISMAAIADAYQRISQQVDWCLVEGVGGWLVPIDNHQTVAELVEYLSLPVVLVVGLRLGCLNHALLSVESIERRNVRLMGWVANQIDPSMARADRNITALLNRIDAPLIGAIPPVLSPSEATFSPYLVSGLTALMGKHLAT